MMFPVPRGKGLTEARGQSLFFKLNLMKTFYKLYDFEDKTFNAKTYDLKGHEWSSKVYYT